MRFSAELSMRSLCIFIQILCLSACQSGLKTPPVVAVVSASESEDAVQSDYPDDPTWVNESTTLSIDAEPSVTSPSALGNSAAGLGSVIAFDVDAVGNIAYTNGTDVQCLNPNFSSRGSASFPTLPTGQTVFTADVPIKIVKAKATGDFALVINTASSSNQKRNFFRVYNSNCVALTNLTALDLLGEMTEFMDATANRAGVFATAFTTWDGDVRVSLFNRDGERVMLTATAPFTGYGIHIALQPSGNIGIVSIQAHSSSPTYFRRFNIATKTWIDSSFLTTPANGAWYDSHLVAINNLGNFVVVQTEYASSSIKAYFYAADLTILTTTTVGTYSASGYDTYRSYSAKIFVSGSDFLIPWTNSDTMSSWSNRLTRYQFNGSVVGSAAIFGPLENAQRAAFDDAGNMFQYGSWGININSVTTP